MSIDLNTLLPLCTDAAQRRERRCRAIAHRRERCLMLGPTMRLQFEDETSVRHQIQEVLLAERINDLAQAQQVIDGYAHLLGNGRQWKATLFIELPEAARRDRELPLLSLAAHHLYLGCGNWPRVVAEANEDLPDRHLGRPSAVHFLRFALPDAVAAALRAGHAAVLGCAHPGYAWQRAIPASVLERLCAEASSAT
jgi:sirohydrochlorin ferrochelatase